MRPEDLKLAAEGDTALYSGKVAITEALGEVTLLYFVAEEGKDPVIAKLPGIHQGLRGQEVSLVADPSKLHMFADGLSMRK